VCPHLVLDALFLLLLLTHLKRPRYLGGRLLYRLFRGVHDLGVIGSERIPELLLVVLVRCPQLLAALGSLLLFPELRRQYLLFLLVALADLLEARKYFLFLLLEEPLRLRLLEPVLPGRLARKLGAQRLRDIFCDLAV